METIKEEKKADLEQLLKKLLELGYKPFGITTKILHIGRTPNNYIYFDGGFGAEHCYSIRELVSKESGLWQFVCENGIVDINYGNIREYYSEQENGGIYLKRLNGEDNYEYRLIESSLKDESELEDFLLNSIKLD